MFDLGRIPRAFGWNEPSRERYVSTLGSGVELDIVDSHAIDAEVLQRKIAILQDKPLLARCIARLPKQNTPSSTKTLSSLELLKVEEAIESFRQALKEVEEKVVALSEKPSVEDSELTDLAQSVQKLVEEKNPEGTLAQYKEVAGKLIADRKDTKKAYLENIVRMNASFYRNELVKKSCLFLKRSALAGREEYKDLQGRVSTAYYDTVFSKEEQRRIQAEPSFQTALKAACLEVQQKLDKQLSILRYLQKYWKLSQESGDIAISMERREAIVSEQRSIIQELEKLGVNGTAFQDRIQDFDNLMISLQKVKELIFEEELCTKKIEYLTRHYEQNAPNLSVNGRNWQLAIDPLKNRKRKILKRKKELLAQVKSLENPEAFIRDMYKNELSTHVRRPLEEFKSNFEDTIERKKEVDGAGKNLAEESLVNGLSNSSTQVPLSERGQNLEILEAKHKHEALREVQRLQRDFALIEEKKSFVESQKSTMANDRYVREQRFILAEERKVADTLKKYFSKTLGNTRCIRTPGILHRFLDLNQERLILKRRRLTEEEAEYIKREMDLYKLNITQRVEDGVAYLV